MGSHSGHSPKSTLPRKTNSSAIFSSPPSLAKLEREKISQRTKAGLERARAKGKVLGRPRFSDGDRDKLVAALVTGDSWHAVSRRTQNPYSTDKKHARALGYEPQRANAATKIPMAGG
jgi:DNA invertase Pin-like site-specific DNA recombinase